MSIKYGEVTIINDTQINIFNNISKWLGFEKLSTKESKFVFLFEDGDIYDMNNLKDYNFKFINNNNLFLLPVYFDKNNKRYFYKKPIMKDNHYRLDFTQLFNSYKNYNSSINMESYYNCIYYCNKSSDKKDVFSILRIKSSNIMPRFNFAYDNNEFTKDEIIYIIHYILTL